MPRLSFSLRDVFWLTLVVGMGVVTATMGVAWLAERASREADREFMLSEINELNLKLRNRDRPVGQP